MLKLALWLVITTILSTAVRWMTGDVWTEEKFLFHIIFSTVSWFAYQIGDLKSEIRKLNR